MPDQELLNDFLEAAGSPVRNPVQGFRAGARSAPAVGGRHLAQFGGREVGVVVVLCSRWEAGNLLQRAGGAIELGDCTVGT